MKTQMKILLMLPLCAVAFVCCDSGSDELETDWPVTDAPGTEAPEGPSVSETDDIAVMFPGVLKTVVRPGVEWFNFHGLWEGQIRNINIVRTALDSHNRLGIYYEYGADDDYITKKCEFLDALVGANGPMACCHYVRVDGITQRIANQQDPWIANCALVIDDGVPDIVKVNDNYAASALTARNVATGGPLLVFDGEVRNYPDWADEDFLKITHPRTAFGISQDGKTVFHVTVDGRWTTGSSDRMAVGMEIPLLAKLMKGIGCYKAINFDGGGGTAMWIYGRGVNGIVNHPCDKPMNWDNPTLRTCGSAIYISSDLK